MVQAAVSPRISDAMHTQQIRVKLSTCHASGWRLKALCVGGGEGGGGRGRPRLPGTLPVVTSDPKFVVCAGMGRQDHQDMISVTTLPSRAVVVGKVPKNFPS